MTRIDFYFNVADKYREVAELAEIALARQRRLFIYTGDADAAERLALVLWTHQPTSFLPHCLDGHALAAETPIVLGWATPTPSHDDILINLSAAQPFFFSRFRGLIELVGLAEDDRALARKRYRYYRDLGYEIRNHDRLRG